MTMLRQPPRHPSPPYRAPSRAAPASTSTSRGGAALVSTLMYTVDTTILAPSAAAVVDLLAHPRVFRGTGLHMDPRKSTIRVGGPHKLLTSTDLLGRVRPQDPPLAVEDDGGEVTCLGINPRPTQRSRHADCAVATVHVAIPLCARVTCKGLHVSMGGGARLVTTYALSTVLYQSGSCPPPVKVASHT